MKTVIYTLLTLMGGVCPAMAITVTTPSNGARLTSPFTLTANTATCGSQPAVSMGYSLDYGATTVVPTSFNALVIAGNGQHVLHVKCWGSKGAAVDDPLEVTVVPPSPAPPATIVTANSIQTLPGWEWNDDPGTPGASSGSSTIVASPSLSGAARRYSMSFTNLGGEIYHTTFGTDPNSTHFVYDAQLWITNPASIANIEMDMNQVIANGNTVIYGVQCDGYSGTWDYTVNAGTPSVPIDHWVHSNVTCPKPSTWAPNTWHHIQIAYSRDSAGNVTYQTVVLNGVESDFSDATVNSAFALGWGSTLLTNFQLDGLGASGSTIAYLDNLTVYRW
ncbi:MAG: hypothetical protein WA802_01565 [Terracidiphilus sp.]